MYRSRPAVSWVASIGVVFLLLSQAVWAGEPLEGTWVLNREKSMFGDVHGPQGQMRKYVMSDGVETMTSRGISADGKPTWVKYEARYDGKDYPVVGSAGGDKISLRRIDSLTTESTEKSAGKTTVTAVRRLSLDGKTLTVETKGTLPDGRVLNATMVFEKKS
jgi:hypothetical protein